MVDYPLLSIFVNQLVEFSYNKLNEILNLNRKPRKKAIKVEELILFPPTVRLFVEEKDVLDFSGRNLIWAELALIERSLTRLARKF